MIFLELEDLLVIADRVVGPDAQVRDLGLLEAAVARPRATLLGEQAYPDLLHQAAALVQSVVMSHALIDGNKRLGLGALIAFLGMNGVTLGCSNDEAYEFVMAVAEGSLADVDRIAMRIGRLCRQP